MFVHTVYFWLKADLTHEQHAVFQRGLESLSSIEMLTFFHVGTPAATDRPVVDRSYDYALVVAFDSQAGHDAYQVHPQHLAFVEQYKANWERIRVYDSE